MDDVDYSEKTVENIGKTDKNRDKYCYLDDLNKTSYLLKLKNIFDKIIEHCLYQNVCIFLLWNATLRSNKILSPLFYILVTSKYLLQTFYNEYSISKSYLYILILEHNPVLAIVLDLTKNTFSIG